jgi:hypothetical protein
MQTKKYERKTFMSHTNEASVKTMNDASVACKNDEIGSVHVNICALTHTHIQLMAKLKHNKGLLGGQLQRSSTVGIEDWPGNMPVDHSGQ